MIPASVSIPWSRKTLRDWGLQFYTSYFDQWPEVVVWRYMRADLPEGGPAFDLQTAALFPIPLLSLNLSLPGRSKPAWSKNT
jgi:hypothetical protein